MSEPQEIYGVGLARRAEEFAEAAEHLVTKDDLGPVSFVFLFLTGHALELVYKSVLLNRGATEGKLRNVGHDLIKCRKKACACFPGDLAELEEAGTDEVVAMVSPYYKAKAFEYHTSGHYQLPDDIAQVAAITSATVNNIARARRGACRAGLSTRVRCRSGSSGPSRRALRRRAARGCSGSERRSPASSTCRSGPRRSA